MVVGLALAAAIGAAAPQPAGADLGDSLAGHWTIDRAASGDVRRAIDTVTARMNFFIRPIARSRLRSANEVHEHLTITISPTEVATQVDRHPPIMSPVDGTPVTWTRENGDVFRLHTVLTGERLVQTFVGKDASSRQNVFVPSSDGRTLVIGVTVAHPRLPRPVTYELVYRRDPAAESATR
ncbi:hypothetical protein tb265_22090 [Gemmatimonadetes bacterium T265]|nr:hypothetical protein tb265_22090 [Gemmatimonadetes bacterium T265]